MASGDNSFIKEAARSALASPASVVDGLLGPGASSSASSSSGGSTGSVTFAPPAEGIPWSTLVVLAVVALVLLRERRR